MNEKTLRALKGSIRKWEAIVAGTERDEGTDNCPLCQKFFANYCEGCPIQEKTGKYCCDGSPYEKWTRTSRPWAPVNGGYLHTKESLAAAKAELKFLKSLLPKDA